MGLSFSSNISWQCLAQDYAGQVFGSDHAPISDVPIDIEWLDNSTLQVIVELPGEQIEMTEVRAELDLYVSDTDDKYVYSYRDVAIWTSDS